jgi:DnaJ-class molecular chaperone
LANVGKVRYDSLRILGLREGATEGGATEGEGKAAYRAMSRIYHPDKHNSGFTGMSDEEAVEFFQHLNNAHSYLQEISNVTDTEERKKYERTNNEL